MRKRQCRVQQGGAGSLPFGPACAAALLAACTEPPRHTSSAAEATADAVAFAAAFRLDALAETMTWTLPACQHRWDGGGG